MVSAWPHRTLLLILLPVVVALQGSNVAQKQKVLLNIDGSGRTVLRRNDFGKGARAGGTASGGGPALSSKAKQPPSLDVAAGEGEDGPEDEDGPPQPPPPANSQHSNNGTNASTTNVTAGDVASTTMTSSTTTTTTTSSRAEQPPSVGVPTGEGEDGPAGEGTGTGPGGSNVAGEGEGEDEDTEPIDMHFCGVQRAEAHESSGAVSGAGSKKTIWRPEALRSEKCDTDGCSPCTHRDNCWHGKGQGSLGSAGHGVDPNCNVEISLAPGGENTNYSSSIWAKCGETGGTWKVSLISLTNGNLSIYESGVLKKTYSQDKSADDDKPSTTNINVTGDTQIRVEIYAKDINTQASAQVSIFAVDVDPFVDKCMDFKDCLQDINTSQQAGYLLRNSNTEQMYCLEGSTDLDDSLGNVDDINSVCGKWVHCLHQRGQVAGELLQVLQAAFGTDLTLIEIERLRVKRKLLKEQPQATQETQCTDPSIVDAEAFECDCLDDYKKQCKDKVNKPECYREVMCKSATVCQDWKTGKCNGMSLLEEKTLSNVSTGVESSLVARRLLNHRNSKESVKDLDATITQKKCQR